MAAEKIIILLDMDCFYVQVEERSNPSIKGKPAAVVQYNTWKGGGLIAVNYEARAFGVKRGMRGDEAKEKCPAIQLVQVPVQRDKADLTKYRDAGKEVISVLCEFSDCVERASIDEAYIDLTKVVEERLQSSDRVIEADDLPSTWVIGYEKINEKSAPEINRKEGLVQWLNEISDSEEIKGNNSATSAISEKKLSIAAVICEEIRKEVLHVTGFKCSAGISHNKMLGKLACGLHKPNQQSILPMRSVASLWSDLPIGKVRNLGGKLGDSLTTQLSCKTMADLAKIPIAQLRAKYDEKTAYWLDLLGQGIDNECVSARQLPKSIGCGKNFNGKDILNTKHKVNSWMENLASEISERLEEDKISNDRIAKTLTVHVRLDCEDKPVCTRSCPLSSYKTEIICRTALSLIASSNTGKDGKWVPPIRNISLSASKFDDLSACGTTKIKDIFKKVPPTQTDSNLSSDYKSEIKTDNKIIPGACNDSSKCKKSEKVIKNSSDAEKVQSSNAQNSFFLQFLVNKNAMIPNISEKNINNKNTTFFNNSNHSESKVTSKPIETILNINKISNTESFRHKVTEPPSSQLTSVSKLIRKEMYSGKVAKLDDDGKIASKSISQSDNGKQSKISKVNSESYVSIHELFPDIDDADPELVAMLPDYLRKELFLNAKKRSKRTSGENSFVAEKLAGEKSEKLSLSTERTGQLSAGEEPSYEGKTTIATSSKPEVEEQNDTLLMLKDINQKGTFFKEVTKKKDCVVEKRSTTQDESFKLTEPATPQSGSVVTEALSKTNDNPQIQHSNSFKFCKECNRKVLQINWIEHCDYHYAMELRKQQMNEMKCSLLDPKRKRTPEKQKLNPKKSKNSNASAYSFTPKIDNFFKKKDL